MSIQLQFVAIVVSYDLTSVVHDPMRCPRRPTISDVIGMLADAKDRKARLDEEIADLRSQLRNYMLARKLRTLPDASGLVKLELRPGDRLLIRLGARRFRRVRGEPYLAVTDKRKAAGLDPTESPP